MRFIPNGPDVPEELLIARDQGKVIFFCGAGVSRAKAKLPGFEVLGQKVIDDLGSTSDSPARRLLEKSFELGRMAGVGGLVATDRVFSLLEKEFEIEDVRRSVAQSVRPPDNADLTAHRVLLKLSTPPNGSPRLVTTNFDLLFEDCDQNLKSWGPPHLPDPRNAREFLGVVHLHGRVDPAYAKPNDDEFVVSSADFGRAYLADGWATRFIQMLLDRYSIVFVGYSADDPPVQYLLEALKLPSGGKRRLYAFQDGGPSEAAALWENRGVTAIAFDPSDDYVALWGTLSAWATRSEDIKGWHDQQLLKGEDGPAAASEHLRTVLARLTATPEGARRLAVAEKTLDARWLLAFDPKVRYERPIRLQDDKAGSSAWNPFEVLSLDSDTSPATEENGNPFGEQSTPPDAFSPFDINSLDRAEASRVSPATFFSTRVQATAQLPPRLQNLAIWLAKIAHDPITLWWAARQDALHPRAIDLIENALTFEPFRFEPELRKRWRLLLKSWDDRRIDPDQARYRLERKVKSDGWSGDAVRELVAIDRPQLLIRSTLGQQHPLEWTAASSKAAFSTDVDYPHPNDPLDIPDSWLEYAVQQFRGNLELGIALEFETTGNRALYLQTTRADDGIDGIDEDAYGVAGPVASFQNLMSRLTVLDSVAAHREFSTWPDDDFVFTRLRIWAASRPDLLGADEAARVFMSLSDAAFWGSTHERDLLYAMRDRWQDMGEADRKGLEARLETGTWTANLEDGPQLEKMIAFDRLNRMHWLADQGVRFELDLDALSTRLRLIVPEWQPEYATRAGESTSPKAYNIATDEEESGLLNLPVREILQQAYKAATVDFDRKVRREPFRGLAARRPALALKALSVRAKSGDVPKRAWVDFLLSEGRQTDSLRLIRVIAGRLQNLSLDQLNSIAYGAAHWMKTVSGWLYGDAAAVFRPVWDRLIEALSTDTSPSRHRANRDWAEDAINAPTGFLVQLLFNDPIISSVQPESMLPNPLKTRFDQLLSLPGDMRRQALNLLALHLPWFFNVDRAWTTAALLPVISEANEDGKALWDGLLRSGRLPSKDLFVEMKPAILARARRSPAPVRSRNNFAGMILAAWNGIADAAAQAGLVTNAELRDLLVDANDDFRRHIIYHLRQWSKDLSGPWHSVAVRFLDDVWPKQRALRTSAISSMLADFALDSGDLMPEITRAIMTRLVPVPSANLYRLILDTEKDDYPLRKYPSASLDLLWAILPDNREDLPYGFDNCLKVLEETSEIAGDPRLAEFRRRLES